MRKRYLFPKAAAYHGGFFDMFRFAPNNRTFANLLKKSRELIL